MHGTVCLANDLSLRSFVCGAAALPLKEDYEEAGPVYGALCGLATNTETAPKVANLMPQLVQVGLPYSCTTLLMISVGHFCQ